jgi:hypothetical protein
MSSYGTAHPFRRAARVMILICCAIAEIECHQLSIWVDSTCIQFQPASRIIHTSWAAFN